MVHALVIIPTHYSHTFVINYFATPWQIFTISYPIDSFIRNIS